MAIIEIHHYSPAALRYVTPIRGAGNFDASRQALITGIAGRDRLRDRAGAGAPWLRRWNGFGDAAWDRGRVKALRDTGADADYHGADLSMQAQVEDMVAAAERRFGAVDIAVNNAVTRTWGHIDELPVEKWNYALAVNLTAPFHVIRLTMPGMKKRVGPHHQPCVELRNHGASTTSAPSRRGRADQGRGARGLPYNICTNAICPGATLTPNARKLVADRMAARNFRRGATTDYLSDRPRAASSHRRRWGHYCVLCMKTPARSPARRRDGWRLAGVFLKPVERPN